MSGGALFRDRSRVCARGSSRRARPRIAWMIAVILAATATVGTRAAHAQDRIGELTQTLSSTSEKARLAAAVALGNIGDRRAMKPLVTALSDPSPQIRVVAAAALGKIGHKATLPALKGAANDDADATVRTIAREAAILVAKANQLPSPWPDPAPAPAPAAAVPAAPPRPGFGKQPRALEPAPEVYVLVNTLADESPGIADKTTRKANAEIVRQALADRCKQNPGVTTSASEAKRFGLAERHIDLSVVKMDVATAGPTVEVAAELRLAISDGRGKMLSFLSGGAKLQVPKARFDARYLPKMRREALENAVQGLFDKLVAHLRDQRANS